MPGQQLGSRVERHITEVSSSPIILHKHIAPGSILNIHYSTMNELHKRIYKLIELTTSNGICMCFNGVSRCHLHVGTIETSILPKKKSPWFRGPKNPFKPLESRPGLAISRIRPWWRKPWRITCAADEPGRACAELWTVKSEKAGKTAIIPRDMMMLHTYVYKFCISHNDIEICKKPYAV